jgi:hypothetical protein
MGDHDGLETVITITWNAQLELFSQKKVLRRASIYSVIDPELRQISKEIVAHLVKQKLLLKHGNGSDAYYLCTAISDELVDELALRTWQHVC